MSIKVIIDYFKSEGAVIKGAPGAFVISVFILTGLLLFGFGTYRERHHAELIAEKDATNKKLESANALERQEYEQLENRASNTVSELLKLSSLVNDLKTTSVDPAFGASGELLALRKQLQEVSDRLQSAEVRIPKERVLSAQSIALIKSILKGVKDKSIRVVINYQILDKSARKVNEQLQRVFSDVGFRNFEPNPLRLGSTVSEVRISFQFVPEETLVKAATEIYHGLNVTNTIDIPEQSLQKALDIIIGYLE